MANSDVNIVNIYEEPPLAILVDGIEDWITGLLPLEEIKYLGDPVVALRMLDSKTGALFLVKRLK